MIEYIVDVSKMSDGLYDAVEGRITGRVVRCRDCKHYQDHNFGGKIDWCRYFHHDIESVGFCKWGERKSE